MAFINEPIVGRHVIMRSVESEDAEFILKLRLDDSIRPYISPTENSVEKQVEWINNQRQREGDYYFLYTDKKGEKLGVISVYNIENGVGETGRQMSFGGSVHNMEAEYLMMRFVYESLKLDKVISTVYLFNRKAIGKAKKLGIKIDRIVKVNGIDSYYVEITANDYQQVWKPKMEFFLEKVAHLEL